MPRLTEAQRRVAVSEVLNGKPQTHVAKDLGCHPSVIYSLMKSVREAPEVRNSPALALNWREKLTRDLPAKAVDTLELSISDRGDVHKAAGSALQLLKGIGALSGDGTTVNFIQNNLGALPPDWQDAFNGINEVQRLDDAAIEVNDVKPLDTKE